MLVLSRAVEEAIVLKIAPSPTETTVLVVVTGLKGRETLIGIEAPRSVRIFREELDERGRPSEPARTARTARRTASPANEERGAYG